MKFDELKFKAGDFESVVNFLEPRLTFKDKDDRKIITKYVNEYVRDLANRILAEKLERAPEVFTKQIELAVHCWVDFPSNVATRKARLVCIEEIPRSL